MRNLISKSALIEEFRKIHFSFNGTPMEESDMMISYRSLARVINRQPTVEAKPVVHGEWMKNVRNNGGYITSITCSACGYAHSRVTYNFCPECGADMRGGKNG